MAKAQYLEHGVKHERRINHPVHVKLAQIFYFCKPTLIKFEVVQLKTDCYVLKEVVNNRNSEVLVIAVQGAEDDCKKMNITVFDLARSREYLTYNVYYLGNVSFIVGLLELDTPLALPNEVFESVWQPFQDFAWSDPSI